MPENGYTMLKGSAPPFWESYDPRDGAYYYVYGKDGSVSTYKKVSATIALPPDSLTKKKLKGTGGGRTCYISFGVECGGDGGIDIGIRNRSAPDVNRKLPGDGESGFGWEPYCYECKQDKAHYFENNRAPSGTTKARVEVTPNLANKKFIQLKVEWIGSTGNVLDTFNKSIELSKQYNWNNFLRFASLVSPDSSAKRTDSTYVLDGAFEGVKLGTTNWGITQTAVVSKAWIINHPKCQVTNSTSTGEKFKIDHWA